jgi:hypothetical protein
MSGLNDLGMQWFPRDCVTNHAINIFAECGANAAPR